MAKDVRDVCAEIVDLLDERNFLTSLIVGILMTRPLSSPHPLPLRSHAASFDRGCPAASFPDSFIEQRRLPGRNVASKSAQRASQL